MSKIWNWWTIYFISVISLIILLFYLDYAQYLLETDSSYLSFCIIVIYLVLSTITGVNIYKGNKLAGDTMHFCGEKLLTGLGFIGTLIGIMLMFSQGVEVDLSNVDAAQEYNAGILNSIGTAVQTSLFGIISALLLQLQLSIQEG